MLAAPLSARAMSAHAASAARHLSSLSRRALAGAALAAGALAFLAPTATTLCACLLLCAAATLHKAHRDAALFRNAMNFTTDVRPPLAASDKLRACTGLVDQPNRQMMQASWQALDPNGDGQLTIHDYVLT